MTNDPLAELATRTAERLYHAWADDPLTFTFTRTSLPILREAIEEW